MDRKKPQVPPLRSAPTGMTNSFKLDDFARKINKVADLLFVIPRACDSFSH
jgi:hypothetical protein